MFGLRGLFIKYNAYVPEGSNEEGRVATPTSFSIVDFLNYFIKNPQTTNAPIFLTHNIIAIGGVLNNLRLKCFANLIVRHLLKFCSLTLHYRVP